MTKSLTLEELLKSGLFIDGDWIESKDQDPEGDVRLIQLADVGDGVFHDKSAKFLTMSKARDLKCTFLEPGDILIARMPDPLGRACIFPGVGQPAVTAVDICIIRPGSPGPRVDWLVNAINSPDFRSSMQQFVHGDRGRISRKNLGKLTIHAPDIDTQNAMAEVIDTLRSKRDNALLHINFARRAADRFRRATLLAACAGHLTAKWRDKNPISGLINIEAVETRLHSQILSREIPETWILAEVDKIGQVQLGGTPSRTLMSHWHGNIPWVSSGEVANCRINTTRETISELGLANSSAKIYPKGTVLIAMIGEGKTRGQSAILDIIACTNQNAAGIIPNRKLINPEYLWLWALGEYEITRNMGRGGNQAALNKQKVGELLIPIPPLPEQNEIARRVRQIFTKTDELSQEIDTATVGLDRVMQSILAGILCKEVNRLDVRLPINSSVDEHL